MEKEKKGIVKKLVNGVKDESKKHELGETPDVEKAEGTEEDGKGGPSKKYKNLCK